MFRGLKKRLATANGGPRDSSGHSASSHQGGGTNSGGGGGGGGTSGGGGWTMRLNREAKYDVPKLKSKVLHLNSFDACVEAADLLAVQVPGSHQEEQSSLSRKQHPSGLPDASVLVSVDGNLLLIPPSDDPRSVFRREPKAAPPITAAAATASLSHSQPKQADDIEPTKSTESDESGSTTPMFSKLMADGKDDYESAMYLGNDIDGDKSLNGFSAMGWSLPASSHALGQCEASLQNLQSFTKNILLHRKEASAKTSQACCELREYMPSLGGSPPVPLARSSKISAVSRARSNSDEWEIVDPKANEFVPNTATRTGPLGAPNSTMDHLLVILEEYFARSAEMESEFWSKTLTEKGSLLANLNEACQRVSERVQQREEGLEEASQRARLLEERLHWLRKEASQKWAKVYRTEDRAQAKLESLWQERSRQKERARLERLHEEGEAAQSSTAPPTHDIMSLVAHISEDGGSFEPMELGVAMPTMDKNSSSTPGPSNQNVVESSAPVISAVSRDEVEDSFKLNELRAAALAADELVEDAAQDLLQALTNLDTTRRSARVVAETTMVSAGNAQVHCIRDFVLVEKNALQERLALVEQLEKNIAVAETNVRQDLNAYITQDKRERGGTSHLGDDDDGGIASALAVLSSHVDAQIEGDHKAYDEHWDAESQSVSREAILAAIDQLFDFEVAEQQNKDSSDTHSVDEAVELLCRVAASPNSRSRRSGICYALNSKRSTSAEVHSLHQFNGLCKVFDAILQSYVADESGMTNAKMLMMLAQTFYFLETTETSEISLEASPSRPRREKRIYVRNRLIGHAIWKSDAFWDEAFRTAMAESLTVSGVMSNFERRSQMVHKRVEHGPSHGSMLRWFDLNCEERLEAASQVHAVICAQLGALAHSMIEFGCGLERSCAFVRRTAVRNQLPTSQRAMLLRHLITRHDAELLKVPKLS